MTSVKNQIASLCKLSSMYEEISLDFLDKTHVNSHLSHIISDFSQTQHRTVLVRKGSNKKIFAIKLFQFFDLKTQKRYIFQEEVKISKGELSSVVDSLRDFLKTKPLIKRNRCDTFEIIYGVWCNPLDSGFENSIIKPIGNVYCPKTLCSDIFCVHKMFFQSLSRTDYQCPQSESMCQVRHLRFEEQTISFFLKLGQETYIVGGTKKINSKFCWRWLLANMPIHKVCLLFN